MTSPLPDDDRGNAHTTKASEGIPTQMGVVRPLEVDVSFDMIQNHVISAIMKNKHKDINTIFLREAGLRYRGPRRTLLEHFDRLTSDPHISLNDVALAIGVSDEDASALLNGLEDKDQEYLQHWAGPLGRVLRPMIAKRVNEEYAILAEGYEFERERGHRAPVASKEKPGRTR